jgi:hypothetical protein
MSILNLKTNKYIDINSHYSDWIVIHNVTISKQPLRIGSVIFTGRMVLNNVLYITFNDIIKFPSLNGYSRNHITSSHPSERLFSVTNIKNVFSIACKREDINVIEYIINNFNIDKYYFRCFKSLYRKRGIISDFMKEFTYLMYNRLSYKTLKVALYKCDTQYITKTIFTLLYGLNFLEIFEILLLYPQKYNCETLCELLNTFKTHFSQDYEILKDDKDFYRTEKEAFWESYEECIQIFCKHFPNDIVTILTQNIINDVDSHPITTILNSSLKRINLTTLEFLVKEICDSNINYHDMLYNYINFFKFHYKKITFDLDVFKFIFEKSTIENEIHMFYTREQYYYQIIDKIIYSSIPENIQCQAIKYIYLSIDPSIVKDVFYMFEEIVYKEDVPEIERTRSEYILKLIYWYDNRDTLIYKSLCSLYKIYGDKLLECNEYKDLLCSDLINCYNLVMKNFID